LSILLSAHSGRAIIAHHPVSGIVFESTSKTLATRSNLVDSVVRLSWSAVVPVIVHPEAG